MFTLSEALQKKVQFTSKQELQKRRANAKSANSNVDKYCKALVILTASI